MPILLFKRFHFSNIELKHLTIGTLLFTLVMISMFFYDYLRDPTTENLMFMILLAILTAPLFFLHEIGHKISAQHYNLWAEFRLDPQGALLTAISIFLPFKYIGTGAVMIRANDYSEVPAMGKVAGYGPTINIALGGLYCILAGLGLIIGQSSIFYYKLFLFASGFSFFLGVFNMLPFGPLDGKKVKYWNNHAFWILFSSTLIFALDCFLLSGFFGSPIFLFESVIINAFPIEIQALILVTYPIIEGTIAVMLGLFLIQKLKDPQWNPGRERLALNDYVEPYYQPVKEMKVAKGTKTHSSAAPINTPCAECGKKELMPFKCSTCHNIFCSAHRLTSRHFCVIEKKD